MKVVFFTSGQFGSRLFADFLDYSPDTVLVTLPAVKKGRGLNLAENDAEKLGKSKGVKIIATPDIKAPEFSGLIRDIKPDLIVTADYGKIIPSDILRMPRITAVNVHPSLLPLYRGASPIRAVLLDGETRTGVTLQTMSDRVDAGNIISQKEIPVSDDDDFGSLSEKLLQCGISMLKSFFTKLPDFEVVPQDEARASYCRKNTRGDFTTNFDEPAVKARNKIRAFSPKPGITVCLNGKLVKVLKAAEWGQSCQGRSEVAGTILICGKEGLIVQCAPDCLSLEVVQPENKKPLQIRDFINGYRPSVGNRFEPWIS